MTGRRKLRAEDAVRTLRERFAGVGSSGQPELALENLNVAEPQVRPKSDRTEQLNARVPKGTKKRVRLMAARDGINLSDVVLEGLALYEAKHGRVAE